MSNSPVAFNVYSVIEREGKDPWWQPLGAAFWHTNTVENFFSIFKRGIYGCYFHVSETHLHRYAAEFDFRHNNRAALGIDDIGRSDRALVGAKGKRLTYATPSSGRSLTPPF